jgi:RNA polymerase sigma-70 factor (ECF subfamily)
MGNTPDPRHAVFTAYAVSLIKYKASQLVRKVGFSRSDRDDLEHDLSLHLLRKAHKFDPARASIETFADRVVNNAVRMILRERRRKCRSGGGPTSSIDTTTVIIDGAPVPLRELLSDADRARRTLREPHDEQTSDDVRTVLAGLPDGLRKIAEAIMATEDLSEAADAAGVARSTLYARMKQLRQRFEDAGLGGE